jgi:hypothetical protein
MLTNHCDSFWGAGADRIAIDTSDVEGEILWRRLSALVRHTGGVKAPARYYRNKLAQEGLTELEKQKALEMFDNWGNQ